MYLCNMENKKRIQLEMPKEMHKKLKDNKSEYGFSSVTPFIRFIIHEFLKKENK